MRVSGIKKTGFAATAYGSRRLPEFEMDSGTETVNRRGDGLKLEYSVKLRGEHGDIRLVLNEEEMRDWYTRLGRALKAFSDGA